MLNNRRQAGKPAATLYERIEIYSAHGPTADFGGEDLRGKDGKPVYPGCRVMREPFFHAGMQVTVPVSWGVVKRTYRQPGLQHSTGCDIVIETEDSRFFWLDQVIRTTRSTAEEKVFAEAERNEELRSETS
jgi:hypothetical protein